MDESQFEEFCSKFRLKQETKNKLIAANVNNETILKEMTERDINSLGLSIGQKIALQNAVQSLNKGSITSNDIESDTSGEKYDIALLQERQKQLERERIEELRRYKEQLGEEFRKEFKDIYDDAMENSVIQVSESDSTIKLKKEPSAPIKWIYKKVGHDNMATYQETTEKELMGWDGKVIYKITERKESEKFKDDDKLKQNKYITTKTRERKVVLQGAAALNPYMASKYRK